jgi:hypothetical protein
MERKGTALLLPLLAVMKLRCLLLVAGKVQGTQRSMQRDVGLFLSAINVKLCESDKQNRKE